VRQVYQTKSPVLFIIFNRPELTNQVFLKIRQSAPTRLYIAADGPRTDRPGEDLLCRRAREVTEQIDWECKVETLFRETNAGCKEAVSSAITWFFEHEEEGIILEDDCLPAVSFFEFCDAMLDRYRNDTRVRHISGCNLQHGKKWGTASYYFSNMTHVWGWAGWRRVWKDYDKELSRFNEGEVRTAFEKIFTDPFIVDTWEDIFKRVKAGEIDTWDYQLGILNFFNNSLSIIPNSNLISNIGFGVSSTHTHDPNSLSANIPLLELKDVIHPVYILPEKEADLYTLNYDFDIENRWKRYNKPKRKFKRWIRSLLHK
jgi:hypothetical protein